MDNKMVNVTGNLSGLLKEDIRDSEIIRSLVGTPILNEDGTKIGTVIGVDVERDIWSGEIDCEVGKETLIQMIVSKGEK